ncbi:MAG: hypothetical protein B7733_25930 [Myxococcales bacterium FL481]|nr:MAG: hypothetical protein B7733_25930 [Myxococcales bacterium FL481]
MHASPTSTPDFVHELSQAFQDQVRRSLAFDLDHSRASLAVVDHYLSTARQEGREPILSLLAAGAGAYFGELVCHEIGGMWLGDGRDAWRLRLLLQPQFVHFSPVSFAFEAIIRDTPGAEDPRLPAEATFGAEFLLPPGRVAGVVTPPEQAVSTPDDATWLAERLAELPPVAQDHFHSLTARFETLSLMLELLAERHARRGDTPRTYTLADYVEALT